MIIVPPDRLSPEALHNLVEEFVSRDGTELTDATEKITAVKTLLRRGDVVIVFDETTRSCNIVTKEQATHLG